MAGWAAEEPRNSRDAQVPSLPTRPQNRPPPLGNHILALQLNNETTPPVAVTFACAMREQSAPPEIGWLARVPYPAIATGCSRQSWAIEIYQNQLESPECRESTPTPNRVIATARAEG
jgi:hypothetical protein